MSAERDELTSIVLNEGLEGAERRSLRQACEDTADAILAAGYCKPRIISTVEELDALPDFSVVLIGVGAHEGPGIAVQKDVDWFAATSEYPVTFRDEAFPATVLYVPNEEKK